MAYSFQPKVAACGYHIHKNATWEEAKIKDNVLTELETDMTFNQSHSWSNLTIKISETYPERSFSTLLLLPEIGKQPNWEECSLSGLQAIPFPCWNIGDSTEFKFWKFLLCYTYKNEWKLNFALFIWVHSQGSSTNITRLRDQFVKQPNKKKKKKKPPAICKSFVTESNYFRNQWRVIVK